MEKIKSKKLHPTISMYITEDREMTATYIKYNKDDKKRKYVFENVKYKNKSNDKWHYIDNDSYSIYIPKEMKIGKKYKFVASFRPCGNFITSIKNIEEIIENKNLKNCQNILKKLKEKE